MMSEPIKDFGVAVSDAMELHLCTRDLSDAMQLMPFSEEDKRQFGYYELKRFFPGREGPPFDWYKANAVGGKASAMVMNGLMSGELPVWFHDGEREHKVALSAARQMDQRSPGAGHYMTYKRNPEPYLSDRPLWVKDADWRRFKASALAAHKGMSPAKRGRRKRSGLHASDAPLVEQMIADIQHDPALRPYAAAKRYAPNAAGTPDETTKAKRLLKRYKEAINSDD